MKRINNDKIFESLSFGLESDAVSHHECTGLIPFLPQDSFQLRSYEHIENYLPDDLKHRN